ncbi:SDR family oxidoreductase [Curtobacterium sp. Leaf261]|uniref:SDR family oxidoreductase n=1 Tax=Curtobacterium sp. Leaf261 TaxID=1736311 RepID=UPI000A53F066|nr:SDR family oxidoreductase [Curtobacterium sp. Leaf261]
MTTWFITGASSGFGRELTEQLLRRGDRVAATARRPELLEDLRADADGRLWTSALDVAVTADVGTVVDRAFAHFGRIDVVVNNAGYGLFAAAEEATAEQIHRSIATNLMGPIDVVRAALPHLRRQSGGRIVQVSSAGGQVAFPGLGYYHATKWGIEGFCESVAAEVEPFGIGVTIVEPGMTPTGFLRAMDVAEPMEDYERGAFGAHRRAMLSGDVQGPNDAGAIAAAMITSADDPQAPLRLPLGVDTFDDLHAAYSTRLRQLEAMRDVARSVRAR